MCYTCVVYKENGIGEDGLNFLLCAIEQHQSNDDGYSIKLTTATHTVIKRTIDFTEFVNFIKDNTELIKNSYLAHLHMRKSTNLFGADYCHLWTKKTKCHLSHNGLMEYSNNVNDTLEFWNATKKELNKNSYDHFLELADKKTSMYSIIFVSYANRVLTFSKNKEIVSYTSEDGIFIVSSDEVDTTTEQITLTTTEKTTKTFFGLTYATKNSKTVLFIVKPQIFDVAHFSDCAYLFNFNLKSGKKIYTVEKPKKWHSKMWDEYEKNRLETDELEAWRYDNSKRWD